MIYRKRGTVARWENGTLIRVTESGVAIEEGERFECHPDPDRGEGEGLSAQPPAIELPNNIQQERFIYSHGVAEHVCGDNHWLEETTRLHLSIARERMRVLIDEGTYRSYRSSRTYTSPTPNTATIAHIANALARAETAERPHPPRLRLAPNVTAAVLPALIGLAPPNVRLLQTAGGIDGYGDAVVEADGDWPNVYRPSYRIRPVRMPLDLRLECDVTDIDEDRPRAIALLGAVRSTTIAVLIEEKARVYPSVVRITRIDAVAAERVWYPYGAGSFGAEMML